MVGVHLSHPNGNVYVVVLMTGPEVSVVADGEPITSVAFLDVNDDIVNV